VTGSTATLDDCCDFSCCGACEVAGFAYWDVESRSKYLEASLMSSLVMSSVIKALDSLGKRLPVVRE